MASLLEVVQKQLDKMHPIGSYYLTEDDNNPSISLGFGTWVKIEGKFLLGSSSSYATANEGGEATHTLSNAELPKLSGSLATFIRWKSEQSSSGILSAVDGTSQFPSTENQNNRGSTIKIAFGGDQPHNNMPPYRVVNIWRRTA